jgi:hypothetical protein
MSNTTLTSVITSDKNAICAWVYNNDQPWVEQPFNPDGGSAWETEAQAKQWVDDLITELTTSEETND